MYIKPIVTTFEQLFEESRVRLDNSTYIWSKASEILRGTTLVSVEGLPAAPQRDGVLLGVAFYSLPDLQFLDDVVIRSRDMRIDVFDVLSFKSMSDFEGIFSGLRPVMTPVIGIWKNGNLIEKGCGIRETRRILQNLFT